jgi:methylenetetrahydrofolate dehydrogenase (NADP+)/methenyltetrahydrofolate cyclohydrolase
MDISAWNLLKIRSIEMGVFIDGKLVAAAIKAEVAKEVKELKEYGRDVGLAVILVGENLASQVYVKNKKKTRENME